MKKFFISFLLSIVAIAGYAQEYKPLLVDGRVWIAINPDLYDTSIEMYSVEGDSIVDGVNWKVIHQKSRGARDFDEEFLVREQDRKLIRLKTVGPVSVELVDMDFNDSNIFYYGYHAGVDESTITVNDREYRRMVLYMPGSDADHYKNIWVEGIGMMLYDERMHSKAGAPETLPYVSYLIACYDNGECVFKEKDFLAGAVSGINEVISDNVDKAFLDKLFNLLGQPVNNVRKGEIIIRNGKKVLR